MAHKHYADELVTVSEDQVAQWKIEPGDRHPVAITGNCPRCGHKSYNPVYGEVRWGAGTAGGSRGPIPTIVQIFRCSCLNDHQRPVGVGQGCGGYWLGKLKLGPDGQYELAPNNDLSLVRAASAFSDAVEKQDERVRSAAEKWLGGVVALYGLFSLAGLGVAKTVVEGLATSAKTVIAALIGLGVTSAAIATIFGYLAAYGWPRRAVAGGSEELSQWYSQYSSYASIAADRLRYGVLAALCSVACLVTAMFLAWFWPRL